MKLQVSVMNPWWAVIAAMVGLTVGSGAISTYAFGIFMKDLAAEMAWSRGLVSGGLAAFMVAVAVGMPVFGSIIDRYGIRRPSLWSVILFATLLASMSRVESAIVYVALFAVMGLVSGGVSPMPYSKAIAIRFDRRRGLALGLGTAGMGIGGVVLPPVASYLLIHYGWRAGFTGLGIAVIALAIPSVIVGLRPWPKSPPGSSSSNASLTGPAASSLEPRRSVNAPDRSSWIADAAVPPWRRPVFWSISIALLLSVTATGGVAVHIVPFLTDQGMPITKAAVAASALGLTTILGRVATGFLMDIFYAPAVAAAVFLLSGVGILTLSLGMSDAVLIVGVMCVGFVLGAEMDVLGYLVSRFFPFEDFGKTYGLLLMVFAVAYGLGTYLMGASYDQYGSYRVALWSAVLMLVVASAFIVRLGPYINALEDSN